MATVNIFNHDENTVSFTAGQTVFEEGQPADFMYVVQEGEVEIMLQGKLLETVQKGGVLGEMALIDPSPRSATAVARTNCKVVPIDENKFKIYVHHTPYFALQVMRIMTDRLRRMNERMGVAASQV